MNMNLPSVLRGITAATVLATVAASCAWAEPFIKTIEKDIETSSSEVSIPASAPASVTVPNCADACPHSLALTAQTTAFIGSKPVTLQALRTFLTSHRVTMTLFYDPASKVLNRIVADE